MAPIVSEEYKKQKKREILSSAKTCFAKKGFHAATIDDIVAHSGISKGAIYNYFKSKDEIYLELMNTHTEEVNQRLTDKISSFSTATEKLLYLFNLYVSNNPFQPEQKESNVVHYEFRLHSSRDENLLKLLRERGNKFFLEFLIAIIEEGKNSGEFNSSVDSYVLSNIFWTVIDGATIQTILYENYPYEKVLKTIKQMVTSMLLVENRNSEKNIDNEEEHGNVDLFMDRTFLSLI